MITVDNSNILIVIIAINTANLIMKTLQIIIFIKINIGSIIIRESDTQYKTTDEAGNKTKVNRCLDGKRKNVGKKKALCRWIE